MILQQPPPTTHSLLLICIFLLTFSLSLLYCTAQYAIVSNVVLPFDNLGELLLTGELSVLPFNNVYYFYINNWGGCGGVDCCDSSAGCASCCFNPPSPRYPDACVYTDNHTVSVYSTSDFVRYQNLGVALSLDHRRVGIEFRPQVIFNAASKRFIMWYEDRWTGQQGYAVATSTTPYGPFLTLNDTVKLAGSGRVGDYALFVDDDGVAYHARTGLVIERLNSDYTTGTGDIYELTNTGVEGPSLFKRAGIYYLLVGVGCCACLGGSNVIVYTATAALGPYALQGDVGTNHSQSFNAHSPYNYITHAQGSAVFAVPSHTTAQLQYIWIGNQWVTATQPGNPRNHDLLYWSVLEFDSEGNIQQFVRKDYANISLPLPATPNTNAAISVDE